jgi:hypothetical protein
MSISHRTNRLKLNGNPDVEQLQNGRYKIVVECTTLNSREDWYFANKERIFPSFGSFQGAAMNIDGLEPRTGEAYTDMLLTDLKSGNRKTVNGKAEYNVILTYETLGADFVQVKDDNTSLPENGLRAVTRVSIAQAGTDIPDDDKDVGVDFINHQIDSETAVKCFLASYEIDDTDSYREFTRNYIQAGVISVETRNLSEGVTEVTTKYMAEKGEPVGPVVNESVNNNDGLKIFTVVTLQDGSGNSILDGGSISSYDRMVDFTYPGIASITHQRIISGSSNNDFSGSHLISVNLEPPLQQKVQGRVHTSFQLSSVIEPVDYKFDNSYDYWNPDSWASVFSAGVALSSSEPAFQQIEALRGYRTDLNTNIAGFGTSTSFNKRKYFEGGEEVFELQIRSLRALSGSRFDFTSAGGNININGQYTGQTSGAIGEILQAPPSRTAGTVFIDRNSYASNDIPFIVGEVCESIGSAPDITLTRSLGERIEVQGVTSNIINESNGRIFLSGTLLTDDVPFRMFLSGGPISPVGKKWVLDMKLEPAFQDVDGKTYYKKTIVTADV